METCFINMDRKLIRNGGRSAVVISKEDFLKKLVKIHNVDINNFKEENISYYDITDNTKIKKDISKVNFDDENNYIDNNETPLIDKINPLLGIHTLENGLTFLGCMSGGDWESPVFFIIYFDGKSLRGYIPSYGNVYNLDFNTAIGSEEEGIESDEELIKKGYEKDCDFELTYLKKQGILEYKIPVVNWKAVKEDIINRIKIRR